jgi:hypothetical protein
MRGFEVVALVIGLFFIIGVAFGVLLVVVLPFLSPKVGSRYRGSGPALDPDDPRDAEKIVKKWLATRDNSADRNLE